MMCMKLKQNFIVIVSDKSYDFLEPKIQTEWVYAREK